jgi:periplasmic protein TonB
LNGIVDWIKSTLGVAFVFSVVAHAVLIVGLGFVKPEEKKLQDKAKALEVVLVNAKTKEAPIKAEALAQSNLDRGGNTDADRQMKSPLPVPKTPPDESATKLAAETKQAKVKAAAKQSEAPRKPQHIAEQEKPAQEVMTKPQSPQKIESAPTQQAEAVEPDQGKHEEKPTIINTADLVARSLDAARLEAQLSKNMDAYQKRPKRKFIGARVREYRFASYVEAWRQKVEKVGNLNYPAAAKEQKLYGRLQLTVSIRADGSIEKIELNRSSGHPILDEAAQRIVELAAPYAAFPEEVRQDTDIIEITRTWTFTREDTLYSGD